MSGSHSIRNRWIGVRFRVLQRLDRVERRTLRVAVSAVIAGMVAAMLYTWI